MSKKIDQSQMLPIGTLLRGNLTVEAYLSSGGFGNTYRVVDAFGQRFAVKEFYMSGITERRQSDGLTVDVSNTQNLDLYNSQLDKFRKEAIRIHNLNHPNIVRVHDLFVENGTAYYMMDLIEGSSLADILRQRGPLPEDEVEGYVRQVLDALEEVHGKHLWHLDIKPANIMIDHQGRAVLIDFGSSKQMRAGGGATTGSLPSFTPGYAPSEQQDQNAAMIGAWTDLYALGATLYVALTGNNPPLFSDLAMKGSNAFDFRGLSSRWAQLIEWMMQLPIQKRPQSVAEVRQALDGYSQVAPEPESAPEPKPEALAHDLSSQSAQSDSPSRPRSRQAENTVIAIAVLAVAVLAVMGIVALPSADEDLTDVAEPVQGNSRTYTVKGVTFTMIEVPGSTFTMGATSEQGSDAYANESPTHSVTLGSYWIGQTEVTQELWTAVMGSNPSYFKGDNLPVESVSWEDCQEFIAKLNALTGEKFRLPTEAEWEYAARGGRSGGTMYAGSNDISSVAWYSDNSSDQTHQVSTKAANRLGIYDMSGNVWEWCQDWYGGYDAAEQTNPQGTASGSYRVSRGGSWSYVARFCRVSSRDFDSPSFRNKLLGLRLARSS